MTVQIAKDRKILYLVRHGAVQSNLDDIYAGRSDEILTETAKKEAHLLGIRMSDWGISVIYASPLKRTMQTALAINHSIQAKLIVDEDLIEMDLGPWTGLSKAQVAAKYPMAFRKWIETPAEFAEENIEELSRVQERVVRCYDRILAGSERISAAVTHAVGIKLAYVYFRGLPLSDYHRVKVVNLSVHEITCTNSETEIKRII